MGEAASPIVIIDEPQSVDTTERSRRAIGNLNPMATLRYSATHRNSYNLLYKLDPITDWAFVTEREEKLYFVRETKSALDSEERRTKENQKIACGRKHFDTLGVDFDVVTSIAEVAF